MKFSIPIPGEHLVKKLTRRQLCLLLSVIFILVFSYFVFTPGILESISEFMRKSVGLNGVFEGNVRAEFVPLIHPYLLLLISIDSIYFLYMLWALNKHSTRESYCSKLTNLFLFLMVFTLVAFLLLPLNFQDPRQLP